MAHHVRTRKIALYSKKDGHILKGKYIYRVECKECKDFCEDATSETRSKTLTDEHHMDASIRHTANHPNDRAHKRVIRNKVKKAGTRGH
jgi:hypothetical protein